MDFVTVYAICLAAAIALIFVVGFADKITGGKGRAMRDWATSIASAALVVAQVFASISLLWRPACIYIGAAFVVMAILMAVNLKQSCKGDAFNNKDVVGIIAGAGSLVLGVLLLIVGIATSVGVG